MALNLLIKILENDKINCLLKLNITILGSSIFLLNEKSEKKSVKIH